MKKFLFGSCVLVSILILSGCTPGKTKSPSDLPADDVAGVQTAPESEQAQPETKKSPKISNDKEENLAELYANVICMMMDPTFREGFREGENDREEPEDAEAAMRELYQSYGYQTEEEVEVALKASVTKDSFLTKMSNDVRRICPESVDENTLNALVAGLRSGAIQTE